MYSRTILVLAVVLLAPATTLEAQDTTTVSDRQLRQRLDLALNDTRKSIQEMTSALARMETLRASVHARITRDSLSSRPTRPQTGTGSNSGNNSGNSGNNSGNSGNSSGGPSSPPAVAPVFEDSFEGGSPAAARNGYGWVGFRPSNGQGVSVSRAVARTGSSSLRFTYGGNADPCADSDAEQRFQLGENLPEVWFEYYVYLPKGGDALGPRFRHRQPRCQAQEDPNGVVSNNKLFALWANNYSTDGDVQMVAEWTRVDDGRSDIRVIGMDSDPRGMDATGTKRGPLIDDSTRGRWMRIRIHAKTSSAPGRNDGVVEIWRDDVQVYSLRGFDLVYPGGNNFFRNGYLLGWANSGFDENTHLYVDDFRIYRSNPGWK